MNLYGWRPSSDSVAISVDNTSQTVTIMPNVLTSPTSMINKFRIVNPTANVIAVKAVNDDTLSIDATASDTIVAPNSELILDKANANNQISIINVSGTAPVNVYVQAGELKK